MFLKTQNFNIDKVKTKVLANYIHLEGVVNPLDVLKQCCNLHNELVGLGLSESTSALREVELDTSLLGVLRLSERIEDLCFLAATVISCLLIDCGWDKLPLLFGCGARPPACFLRIQS